MTNRSKVVCSLSAIASRNRWTVWAVVGLCMVSYYTQTGRYNCGNHLSYDTSITALPMDTLCSETSSTESSSVVIASCSTECCMIPGMCRHCSHALYRSRCLASWYRRNNSCVRVMNCCCCFSVLVGAPSSCSSLLISGTTRPVSKYMGALGNIMIRFASSESNETEGIFNSVTDNVWMIVDPYIGYWSAETRAFSMDVADSSYSPYSWACIKRMVSSLLLSISISAANAASSACNLLLCYTPSQ